MSSPLTIRFDRTNLEAKKYAQTRSAKLVTDVSAKTRAAVRRIIGRAFSDKLTVEETARLLRDTVGLTEDQAEAVYNLRSELANAEPGTLVKRAKVRFRVPKDGASPDFLRFATRRYADALLRYRAMNIARSEIMIASNEGQRQLWLQARAAGRLDPGDQRRWIKTADGTKIKTCLICRAMAGQVTGIDEPFTLPDGTEVMNAHAHPGCRCTEGLVIAGFGEPRAAYSARQPRDKTGKWTDGPQGGMPKPLNTRQRKYHERRARPSQLAKDRQKGREKYERYKAKKAAEAAAKAGQPAEAPKPEQRPALQPQPAPAPQSAPGLQPASPIDNGPNAAERRLLEGNLVKLEQLGGGINDTRVGELDNGAKGVFKPASGESPANIAGSVRQGIKDQAAEREVATYQVAKLVGMDDMVQPTVMRTFKVNGKDEVGSFQEFVPNAQVAAYAGGKWGAVASDVGRAAMFDYVVGNQDRHQGNWMIAGGRLKLIDHGLTFGETERPSYSKKFNEEFMRKAGGYQPHQGQVLWGRRRPRRGFAADEAAQRDAVHARMGGREGFKQLAGRYQRSKAQIIASLRNLGIPEAAIKRTAARIDDLSNISWGDLYGRL